MKKLKWLALIMATLMILTCFTGCSEKEGTPDETEIQAVQQDNDEQTGAEQEYENKNQVEKTEVETDSDNFKVSKLGTVEASGYINGSDAGFYFVGSDEKYTIISLDGSKVTKTDYSVCRADGEYFMVNDTKPANDTDFDGINSCGLVNGYGEIIVPLEYASIDILNERFVRVITAKEKTYNEDDALVYLSQSMISLSPDEDDVLYKGEWQIFDLEKGSVVAGVSGTKAYSVSAKGEYFTYVTDDEQSIVRNAEGKELDSSADLFENSSYFIDDTMYDTNGNKMFTLGADGYRPGRYENGYYVASKHFDGVSKYALLNEKGEVVSAEFEGTIYVEGEFIRSDDKLYDFDGNIILDDCYTVTCDEAFGKYYCVKDNSDGYHFIDSEGGVIAEFTTNENTDVFASDFSALKTTDDGSAYYSFKDKDFIYDNRASAVAPWMVTATDEDGVRHVYETLGNTSLISGFDDSCFAETQDGVYALVETDGENGSYDVYLIEAA